MRTVGVQSSAQDCRNLFPAAGRYRQGSSTPFQRAAAGRLRPCRALRGKKAPAAWMRLERPWRLKQQAEGASRTSPLAGGVRGRHELAWWACWVLLLRRQWLGIPGEHAELATSKPSGQGFAGGRPEAPRGIEASSLRTDQRLAEGQEPCSVSTAIRQL